MSDEEQIPEISEYQGKPMLLLNPGSQYRFQFGLGKAKMILQHIDAIRRFVESNGTSIDE